MNSSSASRAPRNGASVLLVHGAWHGGWAWDDLAARLRGRGIDVHIVDQLPSTRGEPDLGLKSDASEVRGAVEAVHGPVVVVAHSYAGMVVSELAGHPDIVGAVYIAAFAPSPGDSAASLSGGAAEWAIVDVESGLTTVKPERRIELMAANSPTREVAQSHADRMVDQSILSTTQASTTPGWGTTPITYVLATADTVIPPELQEKMSANLTSDVVRLDAPHFPMYSKLDELTDIVDRFLARTAN